MIYGIKKYTEDESYTAANVSMWVQNKTRHEEGDERKKNYENDEDKDREVIEREVAWQDFSC